MEDLFEIHGYQELQHHGVLGMKWGVRKDRGSGGRKVFASNQRRADSERDRIAQEQKAQIAKQQEEINALIKKATQSQTQLQELLDKQKTGLEQPKEKLNEAEILDQLKKSSVLTGKDKLDSLSNEELRRVLDRVKLDREFREATTSSKTKVGSEFAKAWRAGMTPVVTKFALGMSTSALRKVMVPRFFATKALFDDFLAGR